MFDISIKSSDTEEFLDLWFYRPLGFRRALFFRNRGIHPNVVTIISIVLGGAAGICFYQETLRWNVLGVLLLMWANLYDSTDGQLARITGQKTRWGRILDGFAGDCWFFCIYFALAARETFQPIPFAPEYQWGVLIWILCSFCGFWVHGSQCQLADYYRNIHLYFIKGKSGSELDNFRSVREQYHQTPWIGNWAWKVFLYSYSNYTRSQERLSPNFQAFFRKAKHRFGEELPEALRRDFRAGSLPLMKYTNILTFNTRAITLYVCLLVGEPWLYFVFELTVMNALLLYMRYKHEDLCQKLLNQLDTYEN